MSLWTDAEYIQAAEQVEDDIARMFPCIEKRYVFPIVNGTSRYVLPVDIVSIRRITWYASKLFPLPAKQQREVFQGYNPIGAPTWYLYSQLMAERTLRFFPTPNVSITASGNLYGVGLLSGMVMSYWASSNHTNKVIPIWLRRRLIKAGVMAKLYAKEGRGQNLTAAQYYDSKFVAQANMNGTEINESARQIVLARVYDYHLTPRGPLKAWDKWGIGVDAGD